MENQKVIKILNLGAGIQSTAIYLMSLKQDEPDHVPVFDYAIFADTQEEPRSVYNHLNWLKSLKGPPILTGSKGKLGNDLINGTNTPNQRFASIPAFTSMIKGDTKNKGMIKRQCTSEYKINVVEKLIRYEVILLKYRQRMPKDIKIIQYFGLSFDEPRRVSKTKNRFVGHAWSEPRFPLFDLEMTRGDCVEYLKQQNIPHEVPRSACVFCPFKSNDEWRMLKNNDPSGWARAVEIDNLLRKPGSRANRGLDQSIYLHSSCLPLLEVDFNEKGEMTGVANGECEGMCGL